MINGKAKSPYFTNPLLGGARYAGVGSFLILLAIICMQVQPASASPEWNYVESWVYQLTDYKNDKLDEIAQSNFDLAVIDLSRDGGSDYYTKDEIANVKNSGKIVLSYFSIGSIEKYRPEYSSVPADLKCGPVEGWPEEQYVKFWDERWWPVVKSRVDQALNAGFDGVYLDLITTYEEIPIKKLGEKVGREELAGRMVSLVARISKYAKGIKPAFKIVPQNCPELYTWSFWEPEPNNTYINAIDGIGMESVYYMAHDKPSTEDWCEENRKNALEVKKAGKLVLAVDYCKKPECIADAYKKERQIGFVPYVSVEELNAVSKEPTQKH